VQRIALAIIVGLLTFSASGVNGLIVNEPCTWNELKDSKDNACPPTCLTCGCCAQAAEAIAVAISATPDVPIADIADALSSLPRTTPRDILHVPKTRLA
jgi:hypothetical protein